MRSTVKLMLAIAVFATSAAANAQTHDVNVDLAIGKSDPIDFSSNSTLSDVDMRSPLDLRVFTSGPELIRDKPLEGATNFGMRNVYFGIDGNTPRPAGVPTAAPEIDSHFATEAMLLLAGGLIVLRGRRTLKARARG